jgi:acetyl-CoA carboxylase carboxyl transferase subunit beta
MAWWSEKKSKKDIVAAPKKSVPKGVWTKCEACDHVILATELEKRAAVCPHCDLHMALATPERIRLIVDEGSFVEHDERLQSVDALGFRDAKRYADRLRAAQKAHALPRDAFREGMARIEGREVAVGFFVFEYMGGSMGSVVGEKIARLFERAAARRTPALVFSASGGARMQEGILSLMQMAKTTAALARLRAARLPYVSVLLNPTTGGVAASFAMLGDLIYAEPRALIGFAGPRDIEQTIRQKLPDGFQRSEFLLEHGMIDRIVHRHQLKRELARALELLA